MAQGQQDSNLLDQDIPPSKIQDTVDFIKYASCEEHLKLTEEIMGYNSPRRCPDEILLFDENFELVYG